MKHKTHSPYSLSSHPLSTGWTDEDLRLLPKVELHRHLECTLRIPTLRELAPQVGVEIPDSDEELKRQLLVTEPMRDLETVLKKFLATQAVLHSEEILTRITYEAIEDACHEGVRILELRYAPTFIQQGHDHLSYEKIHRSITRGVEMARHLPIAVGLIATIQRTLPVATGRRVADFAIEHRDTFIALDLADNEVGFDSRPFASIFEDAKKAGLRITVHAGEADVPGAEEFVMTAIEALGAERIGHGVQIHRSRRVMDEVIRRGIPLELCLTSNWLTNAVSSLAAHPFRALMEAGVPVTINADDPGIFDTHLIKEYRLLHELHGLSVAEFERCNDTAANASFIPHELKQKHWPRPLPLPRK